MSADDRVSTVESSTICTCCCCKACAMALCNISCDAISAVAGSHHKKTTIALPCICACIPPSYACPRALLSISSLGCSSLSYMKVVRMLRAIAF